MSSTRDILLTAAITFAGGFVAGIAYQTPSARRFRGSVVSSARMRAQWLEDRLAVLENQIHRLEDQLQQTGEDLGRRFRDTVGQHGPNVELKPWEVDNSEVERELRRIPRS